MFRIILVLAILLSGLVVPMAMPEPVYADDSAPLNPNGKSSGNLGGTPDTGLNNWKNLDTDDDASYVYYPAGYPQWNYYDVYTIENFGEAYSAINSITVHWRAARIGAFADYAKVYVNGEFGNEEELNAVWTNYTDTWTTNPSTGLAWTDAEIDALSVRVYLWTQQVEARCSRLYVTVNYDPITAPTVTTGAADNISYSGGQCWADFQGNITNTGGDNVTCRGFVWDTASHDPLVSENVTPPNGYSDNVSFYTAGDWGTGTFSHTVNLTTCTTYYYRSFAGNAIGWDYGEEQTFPSMCDPDIDVRMASNVSANTSRLNALIVDDGGQACDVRFAYGTSSANCTDDALGCPTASCNASSYDTTTAWVNDTYTTGQTPYVDVSSLMSNTTYYYCAQVKNDVSCRCGGEMTFTTESGIFTPTEFVSSPTSSTISLLWVKGVGASNTLVRVSTSTYPTAVTEGVAIYAGTGNSYLYSDLPPGTTYFFSAWGLTAGTYSANYTTTMATTLAAGADIPTLPTPPTPAEWSAEPSVTGITDIPFYALVNYFADGYSMPQATMWYGLTIMFSVAFGFFIYWRGNRNLLAGIICVAAGLCSGAVLGLVYLWVGVFFCVIAASMAWMAQRY